VGLDEEGDLYKQTVDWQDELLARILGAAAHIQKP